MKQIKKEGNEHYFLSTVWIYPGNNPWYFITLPKELSSEIDEVYSDFKRGWGSLRVHVTIGETQWDTSIFPDKKSFSYVLPIKSEVRKKENITEGANVCVSIKIKT